MARPGPVGRLEATVPGGTCVVTAGPGFGKTTFLGEWATRTGDEVAWLTLDAADNDRGRLWSYLAEALGPVLPPPRTVAGAHGHEPERQAASVLERLARARSDVWLVLDDVHLLEEPSVWQDLALVVARLPPTTRVVLAGRHDPPLAMGRLRAAGRVVDIRESQLRFGRAEALAVVGEWGIDAGTDVVPVLLDRTEGWPAGVVLAAAAARDAQEPAVHLAGLRGHDRSVADFLLEEAYDPERPEVRRFLRETSVLDVLTPSLCDAVTGREGSASVLTELERRHVFVTRQEGRAEPAFRYHALFAEVLRLQLEITDPGLAPRLHRRAAAWHEAEGDVSRAVRASLAAGDQATAQRLIEAHETDYVVRGRAATLLEWYRALDSDADVRLLRLAWASLLAGDADAARSSMAALRSGSTGGEWSGDRLEAELDLLGSRVALLDGDAVTMEALAQRAAGAYDRAGVGRGVPARAAADLHAARGRVLLGRPEAAVALLAPALDDPATPPDLRRMLRGTLALALVVGGHRDEAERTATAVIDEEVDTGTPELALIDSLLARATARRLAGRLDLALHDLHRLAEVGAGRVGLAVYRRLQEVERAHVLLDAGDPAAAGQLLDASSPVPGSPLGEWHAALVEREVRSCLAGRARLEALSQRELEVLAMLPSRLSIQEVASQLYVSPNTLKTHLKRVYAKLQVATRDEAVARAVSLRLLPAASQGAAPAPPSGSSRST